jgi:hypothetical protein
VADQGFARHRRPARPVMHHQHMHHPRLEGHLAPRSNDAKSGGLDLERADAARGLTRQIPDSLPPGTTRPLCSGIPNDSKVRDRRNRLQIANRSASNRTHGVVEPRPFPASSASAWGGARAAQRPARGRQLRTCVPGIVGWGTGFDVRRRLLAAQTAATALAATKPAASADVAIRTARAPGSCRRGGRRHAG